MNSGHSKNKIHGKSTGAPAVEYVDTPESLGRLVDRLDGAERIAIDTEADSLYHYFEKVCLIQLSLNGSDYIIDPLVGLDLSPLLTVFAKTKLLLHGGEFDLRKLYSDYGFRPTEPVVDTMLAARLIGNEALGLAELLQQFLNVEISKKGRRSDWSVRPLSEEQLLYATGDTRYLEQLAGILEQKLHDLGRASWLSESCERMVTVTGEEREPVDQNKVWRIKGHRHLDRKQLAFLRGLWYWRDGESQKADRPPFKVVGNETLLDLANWLAERRNHSVASGPKLPSDCKGARLAALKRAVDKVRRLAEDDWPEFLKAGKPPPRYGLELELMRQSCFEVAAGLQLDPSVVATRRSIEAICLAKPTDLDSLRRVGHLMSWQTDLVGARLLKILSEA